MTLFFSPFPKINIFRIGKDILMKKLVYFQHNILNIKWLLQIFLVIKIYTFQIEQLKILTDHWNFTQFKYFYLKVFKDMIITINYSLKYTYVSCGWIVTECERLFSKNFHDHKANFTKESFQLSHILLIFT